MIGKTLCVLELSNFGGTSVQCDGVSPVGEGGNPRVRFQRGQVKDGFPRFTLSERYLKSAKKPANRRCTLLFQMSLQFHDGASLPP